MDRKIIIKTNDLDREIHSLLSEVGADMPVNWDSNALVPVRDAVIEAFRRMGVILDVDERLETPSSFLKQWIRQKREEGLTRLEGREKKMNTRRRGGITCSERCSLKTDSPSGK
jgi:hypothetical protein